MMYYKIINNRQVFSNCKSIQLNETGISNPSAEQIAEAGWLEYIPPVIPPQPQTEPDTEAMMEAVKRMFLTQAEELTDEEALEVAAIFPTGKSKLDAGDEVVAGERLGYDSKLYKVVTTHTPQANWTPDVNKALFTEISIIEYPDGIQPTGAQDAYNTGDKVSHNDKHWVSNCDGNVGEPGVYGGDEP